MLIQVSSALISFTIAGTSAVLSQPENMTTYYLALLKVAPSAIVRHPEDSEVVRKAHGAFMEKLRQNGDALAAGPVRNAGEIGGIAILKDDSIDHTRNLLEAHQAVKAGQFTVEIVPFMAPQGWFRKANEPPQADLLYFGFLVNGPNRGQDADTAARLQREHLAYMDGQATAGRLVLAGPVATREGVRRGVIAYRAKSADEARALAEADPMVKAGRLAVEIYPWVTAKGVFR